jgi:hypothetical protein
MGLVPIFHATVSADGTRLVFLEKEKARRQAYLENLKGQDVDVIVRKHENRRSEQQNRWWFGIAIPLIAHELGYDKHEHDAVHHALIAKCFGTTYDSKMKQEVPNVRSSSRLTTAQFSELMEWAVRWAMVEHGITVPLPGESA